MQDNPSSTTTVTAVRNPATGRHFFAVTPSTRRMRFAREMLLPVSILRSGAKRPRQTRNMKKRTALTAGRDTPRKRQRMLNYRQPPEPGKKGLGFGIRYWGMSVFP